MTRVTRNAVVELLGSPDRTEGNLNSPIEREEGEIHFNEKWIYEHLRSDPAGVPIRTVYWHRYDFAGTTVRNTRDEESRADCILEKALAEVSDRMAPVDGLHRPVEPSGRYQAVSEPQDARDLGGYVRLPGGGTIEET